MSTVKPISSQEEYDSHVASLPTSALSVIYFHAPWAAPCTQMSTILSALASTYPRSDPASVSFISVDAENLPDLSELHDVTAVPFVVLQKSGKTVQTVSGTDAATLRSAVEAHAPSTSTTTSSSSTTLPEKQTVTRPMTQPEPSSLSPSQIASAAASTGGVASTTTTTSSTGAKNLSSYSPSAGDPSTAPQFSSSSLPSGSNGTANGTTSQEELQTRLRDLTHAAPVMLFMKGTPSAPQCGFSRQLVSILRENSVRYGFFNILADDEVRQGLKEYSDWPTFPQLYLNGELVGGLDIVKEELGSNAAFFDEFRVSSARNDGGGPSAAGMTQASGVEA